VVLPHFYWRSAGYVVYGVPLDNKMEFTGSFFTLLRPVPILFGITGLAAILLQGASYSVMKTEVNCRSDLFARQYSDVD